MYGVLCMGFFLLLVTVGGLSIRSFLTKPLQPVEPGPELQKIELGK